MNDDYDPATEFEKIIKHFRPARPFGGSRKTREPEDMIPSVERSARSFKGSGRAFRILTTAYERKVEGKPATQITQEQIAKTIETFPAGPAVQIQIPEFGGGTGDTIHFEAEDIALIISRMPDGKGQGPSGLGSSHLRAISKQVPAFAEHLARLGNALLQEPEAITRVPALYGYRIQCIPKNGPPEKKLDKDGNVIGVEQKFRPICVQEVFLNVLHRHIARKLQDQIPVHKDQYCFRPAGRHKALRLAKKMIQNKKLLQLDVKNAFGSIPHAQIIKMLRIRNPGN